MTAPAFTVTAADVTGRFGLKGMTDARLAELDALIAGCVAVINETTVDWDDEPEPERVAATEQAILYLAHRVWLRDASPFGVAGFGADGSAIRVLREDPDVAMFLQPWSLGDLPT